MGITSNFLDHLSHRSKQLNAGTYLATSAWHDGLAVS